MCIFIFQFSRQIVHNKQLSRWQIRKEARLFFCQKNSIFSAKIGDYGWQYPIFTWMGMVPLFYATTFEGKCASLALKGIILGFFLQKIFFCIFLRKTIVSVKCILSFSKNMQEFYLYMSFIKSIVVMVSINNECIFKEQLWPPQRVSSWISWKKLSLS